MSFRIGKTAVTVGYEAAAALTAVLILDRENRVICCIAAAILHESGHLLMMRLSGVRVRAVTLRIFDVLIEAERPPGMRADVWITLGGVLMNLLCAALFLPVCLRLAAANLALGAFNLLPVISLDGGHLYYLLLSRRFLPKTCAVVVRLTTFALLVPLFTAGLLMLFRSGYNYSLLAISLYLLAVLMFR